MRLASIKFDFKKVSRAFDKTQGNQSSDILSDMPLACTPTVS